MDLLTLMVAGGHPLAWDDFIGQERAKRQLRLKAAGAAKRGTTMGHVLLFSPEPGIGKTSLAMLTAKEAGRNIVTVSGKLSINEMRYHLSHMVDGDVLLWDEIQQQFMGKRDTWEWMLHYMQQGVLMTPMGAEAAPSVTIIGATTDMGLLPETVLQRVETPVELVPYTPTEQVHIACRLAMKLMADNPMPTVFTAEKVAAAASGKPREMQRIWRHLADLAMAGEVQPVLDLEFTDAYNYDLTEVLQWCGVTADGLSSLAQKYILFLYEEMRLEPVGLARISERLGEDVKAIRSVEQDLLNKGFLLQSTRGKAGRTLTTEGLERAKALVAENKAVQFEMSAVGA